MIRIALAIAILVSGMWLFHSSSVYQGLLAGRGQGEWAQLIKDLPFMLRFAGAVFLIIGGAFAFGGKWPGLVVSFIGTLSYVLLTVAMVAMGTDISLWQDDALLTGGLILLCAGLFLTRSR